MLLLLLLLWRRTASARSVEGSVEVAAVGGMSQGRVEVSERRPIRHVPIVTIVYHVLEKMMKKNWRQNNFPMDLLSWFKLVLICRPHKNLFFKITMMVWLG